MPHITRDGKWSLWHRETGERIERWPVDARDILAHPSTEYVSEPPSQDAEPAELTDTDRFQLYFNEAKAAGYGDAASHGLAEGRLRHYKAGGDGSDVLAAAATSPDHPLGIPVNTGAPGVNAAAPAEALQLPTGRTSGEARTITE